MPILAGNLPQLRNRKQAVLQIDSPGSKGVNTLFSETRLDKEEAKETVDLILVEDGILDKRWGSQKYGPDFTAIDGFSEYRKTDGTRELIVIDNGKAYRVTTSAKTEITGATFTTGYQCFFIQSGNYLYIGNGVDKLTRYDGSTLSRYTALSTPAWDGTPLTRGAGLSAGAFTYYYRITAQNAVGETIASTEQSITVNKDRDIWSATNEYIQLDWGDVAGALKYIIYFSDASGYEVKLTEVQASTYQDNGDETPNPYIEPPTADSTGGPELKSMCISGNRIWGTEPDNPYRIYYSGTGVNLGNFSPGFGGGWIDLDKGGRTIVEAVIDFQGDAHAICSTAEGRGAVWEIALQSVSVSGVNFSVAVPTKIVASTGTSSPMAVIHVENDVLFPNKRGEQVLGNEPGVLAVLRTNEVSAKIRPYFDSIYESRFNQICAYYFDARIFISVPISNGDNDRTIVFDRERTAWLVDWTIGVKQFGEYTDSDGITRFLGAQATKLIEFSANFQGDSGVAFTPRYVSPRIPVAKDWTAFGRLKKAYVRLRNVTGSVTFQFAGTGKSGSSVTLATGTIAPGLSDTGMGWDKIGTTRTGWTTGTPTLYASESLLRYLVINDLLRDFQYSLQTSGGVSDRFILTGLMAKGFVVPTGEPSDWKIS